MLPIIEVPKTIASGMEKYRDVFCRDEGFDHVCRYVTGLIISPNKTLQGIYDIQVWKLAGILEKYKKHIEVKKLDYKYVLSNGDSKEVLIIAQ